jgi:putative peptide zinc metalloprotease protein
VYPKFRADLEPSEYDEGEGRVTVVLKDPVAASFFRMSVHEYLFLKELDGRSSPDEILKRLRASGRYYSRAEAESIIRNASRLGLVLGTPASSSTALLQFKEQQQEAERARKFSSVYFLFIPLWNPDRFLGKTLWVFKLFCNKWVLSTLLLTVPGAIYLVIKGTPELERQYSFFFNLENMAYLWITIAFTTLVHEFSHAYTAKLLGRHVPEMGIAMLLFIPCMYCNTTDAWQLSDRKHRIAISAAGVGAEVALAVISVYVWSFSKPGILNSIAFHQFAVSVASTTLFNGNPLMRLDGYYVLMDILRIPNLATKARRYLKYLFFNRVLGKSDIVSTVRTLREKLIFTIYGITSSIYRVGLYSFIIVTAYLRFGKVVGILLGVGAFAVFMFYPLARGILGIYSQREGMKLKLRGTAVLAATLGFLLIILIVPLATKSVFPGFLDSASRQKITIPLGTMVASVSIREGSVIEKGEIILTLDTNELERDILKKENERLQAEREKRMLLLDDKRMGEAKQKALEAQSLEENVKLLQRRLEIATQGIVAPFRGVVTQLDYSAQRGLKTPEGHVIGEMASLTDRMVYGLIPGDAIGQISKGGSVQIWFPVTTGVTLFGTVEDIRPYGERDLKDSPFSSRFGGEVATEAISRKDAKSPAEDSLGLDAPAEPRRDVPIETVYLCTVRVSTDDPRVPLGMSGRIVLNHAPKSLLAMIMEGIIKTFNKEALF